MGRLTLRLPDTLHRQLEVRARDEGVSLNQYLVYALTDQLKTGYIIQMHSEEDVEQQKARFDALVKNLGHASSEQIKQILSEREVVEPEPDLDSHAAAFLKAHIEQVMNQRIAKEQQETIERVTS